MERDLLVLSISTASIAIAKDFIRATEMSQVSQDEEERASSIFCCLEGATKLNFHGMVTWKIFKIKLVLIYS